MKCILVTAFEPFGGERINPSEKILKQLPEAVSGVALCKLLLPVTYRESGAILCAKIDSLLPDAVVMLGQAGGRGGITPERIAINLNHAHGADNNGESRINAVIRADAPPAYFATLPIDAMLDNMREAGIASTMSVSAGAFVCNHISFEALHRIQSMGHPIPAGFIHVPYLPEQVAGKPGVPSMPLEDMVKGVLASLQAVADALYPERRTQCEQ